MPLLIWLLNSAPMYFLFLFFPNGVSERMSLNQSHLAEFSRRFNHADAEERGHDPTVTPFKFTKELTEEFLFKKLQFAVDPGDVKVEGIQFFEVLLP
jgi:hypothetical protein